MGRPGVGELRPPMAMNPAVLLMCAVAAALIAAVVLGVLFRVRTSLPMAQVNDRTLHQGAIPRVGGIALWCGALPVMLLTPLPAWFPAITWLVPCLLVLAVSLRDDLRSLPVRVRLAVHVVATVWFACALAASTGMPWWAAACVALVVAWSLNLYNFMDGTDGLALVMTLTGFGAMAVVLAWRGEPLALPIAVVAAALPVLAVNAPPARMFLGDVGAVPLGFLASALGAAGVFGAAWPVWFPVLAFLPFVADATVTLLRRMARGERFWESHRSHHYQRLHRLGAGHAGTLALYGALMVACAAAAVACALVAPQAGWWALAAGCVLHAIVFASIDYHWRRSAPIT